MPEYSQSELAVDSITKMRNYEKGYGKKIIDTITIHHAAGRISMEGMKNWSQSPHCHCSWNYFIDSDGKIQDYIWEYDRSWCSSSPSNDWRAITIEVSNAKPNSDLVTEEAINGIVALCVDICKRNKIPYLLWHPDGRYIGKPYALTVHRWFTNTNCPGDYLMSRMQEIADRVNEQLSPSKPQEKPKQTVEQKIAELESRISTLERLNKTYDTIEEIPEWAVPAIQSLVDKAFLQGDEGKLSLTMSMIRTFVILDRAKVFNKEA